MNQEALKKWKQLGPIKLSTIALECETPIDLGDDKHEMIKYTQDGHRVFEVVNKDCSYPDVYLRRLIAEDGQIYEG